MHIVITGGIGSGKSTACEYISKGLPSYTCISVDKIVQELYNDDDIKQQLIEAFGTCDRKTISRGVFVTETVDIGRLMEIVNPIPILSYNLLVHNNLIIEFPLYFEYGEIIQDQVDMVISVITDPHISKFRVMLRDAIAEKTYQIIVSRQTSNEYRIEHSDYVIYNNQDFKQFNIFIDEAITYIKQLVASAAKRKGIVSGSFDPITNGHCHNIKTALTVVDYVWVVISRNYNKKNLFDVWERTKLVKGAIAEYLTPEECERIIITVLPERQALVSYAQENDIKFIIKGMRDTIDFNYEYKINLIQKRVAPDIESIYLLAPRDNAEISSSNIKANMYLDEWEIMVAGYIPQCVFEALKEKREHLYGT